MTTAELAQLLGLTPNGVRTRAKRLGLKPVRDTGGGHHWSPACVEKLDDRAKWEAVARVMRRGRRLQDLYSGPHKIVHSDDFPRVVIVDKVDGEMATVSVETLDPAELASALDAIVQGGFDIVRVVHSRKPALLE